MLYVVSTECWCCPLTIGLNCHQSSNYIYKNLIQELEWNLLQTYRKLHVQMMCADRKPGHSSCGSTAFFFVDLVWKRWRFGARQTGQYHQGFKGFSANVKYLILSVLCGEEYAVMWSWGNFCVKVNVWHVTVIQQHCCGNTIFCCVFSVYI